MNPILPVIVAVTLIGALQGGPGSRTPPRVLRVVPAYEGLRGYLAAVRKDFSADRAQLHRRHASEPYERDCRADVVNFEIARSSEEPVALAARLGRLEAVPLADIVLPALARADALLPTPGMTVCVNLVHPTLVTFYMHGGVAAAAIGGNRIMLRVDPSDSLDWRRYIPYMVAQEYHHEVARSRFGDAGTDGTSILMREGRADAFASRVIPDVRGPWTTPLDEKEMAAFLELVRPHLTEATSVPSTSDSCSAGRGTCRGGPATGRGLPSSSATSGNTRGSALRSGRRCLARR